MDNGLSGQVVNGYLIHEEAGKAAWNRTQRNPMHAVFVDDGGDFHDNPIREVFDQAVVSDVHSGFLVTRVGEDAFHDGDDALAYFKLNLRLYMAEVLFVETIEVENALVIGDFISPVDVLAKMAVAGDRHEAELLQNFLEDSPLGPGFGSDMGIILRFLRPLPGLFEILVDAIQRGHRSKELGGLFANIRISIFSGSFVFSSKNAAEVVQAGGADFQLFVGHAQDFGQESGQRADFVAHADELQVWEGTMHGGTDAAHGVAEIEDGRIWADLLGVGADFQDGRGDAQRVEQSAGAAVLAVDLGNAILLGHAPVHLP